jgi:hypothetical protein
VTRVTAAAATVALVVMVAPGAGEPLLRGNAMTRRAALLLTLAILVGAGAPADSDERLKMEGSICDDDVSELFEACAPGRRTAPCTCAPKEFAEACQLGCVMGTCPQVHNCEETPDPKWCGTSCADIRGGLFWRIFLASEIVCGDRVGFQDPAQRECCNVYIEEHCPEIIGTPWAKQFWASSDKSGQPR